MMTELKLKIISQVNCTSSHTCNSRLKLVRHLIILFNLKIIALLYIAQKVICQWILMKFFINIWLSQNNKDKNC